MANYNDEAWRAIKISPNTMTKLNRGEEVSLSVLGKICDALGADIGDVVEYISVTDEVVK